MYGIKFSYESHPKFLGVVFDPKLTFAQHIEQVREKCMKRISILKILANKNWRITKKTLTNIYYALVRSLIDYLSFAYNVICVTNIDKLQRIQNSAVRAIFKPQPFTNLSRLAEANSIVTINIRMSELCRRFVIKNNASGNPLFKRLVEEYVRGFNSGRVEFKKSPLSFYISTITHETNTTSH
jgi:hypothetical protein